MKIFIFIGSGGEIQISNENILQEFLDYVVFYYSMCLMVLFLIKI